LESVTIRLYEFTDDAPFDEAWIYREEFIQGSRLWEETLRLIPEVWDLWYEGNTLYVDIMPAHWLIGGSMNILAERLRRNFLSFPHISEIRFLVGGYPRMPDTGHTNPNELPFLPHIINVETGRATPLCNLSIDDPWIQSNWWQTRWQNECE